MNLSAIIAEYNPFHKGHLYHIEQTRKRTGCDYLIVLMSGDFVQRGEPAVFSKYQRTQSSLLAGADLVLELPNLYACGSAEYFAKGSISILDGLHSITSLSFGCETPDLLCFQELTAILRKESAAYRNVFSRSLKSGMTYPQARKESLRILYPEHPEYLTFLDTPNNLLGLEYAKALANTGSSIQMVPIQRSGAGYHSEDLDLEFASASGIRKVWSNAVSPSVYSLLPLSCYPDNFQKELPAVFYSDLDAILHYSLLTCSDYSAYWDVGEFLGNRIKKELTNYETIESFVKQLKTKNLTETRIRRALLHILLGLTEEKSNALLHAPLYARVLGFRKASAPLFGYLKKNSTLPLVTKLADARNLLYPDSFALLEQDLLASSLYHSLVSFKYPPHRYNEYKKELVIL